MSLEEMYRDYDWWVDQNGYEKEQISQSELSKNIKQLKRWNLRTIRNKKDKSVYKLFKPVTENGYILNFGNSEKP